MKDPNENNYSVSSSSLIIAAIFLVFLSCNNKKQENPVISSDDNKEYIPTLDISSTIHNKDILDSFTWNTIAKEVDFIPLETNNQILLSESSSFPIFIDNKIIIIADYKTQRIYCFNNEGKIISHFSHVGNGPGEYVYLTHIGYDARDSVIWVFDNGNQRIISYDIKGNYQESLSTKDLFYGNVKYIGREKIIVKEASGTHQISIFDKDLNLVQQKLPFSPSFSDKMKLALFLTASTTRNVNTLNQIHNDTLFAFSDTSEEPLLVLEKGKYKMPDSELINFIKLREKRNDFVTIGSIDCFSNYALIKYIYNGNSYINVWDTEKEELICKFLSKDIIKQQEIKNGITYNINNRTSIDILPGYITEKQLAFMVPASELLEEFPYLRDDDNPVLMILKLK